MRENISNKRIVSALLMIVLGCQSTSTPQRNDAGNLIQSLNQEDFADQLEATGFTKCIDSDGRNTGSLNLIWRLKNTQGQSISPFVVGFSGSLRSLQGTLVEFQSMTAAEDDRFAAPPVHNPLKFPLGSYTAYSLLFPYDEQEAEWAFIKINSQKMIPADVTGAQLLVPKFVIGGEYSTRYYLSIEGGGFHEFSCQAINEKVRARLSTFMRKDGSAAFDSNRGSRAKLFLPAPKTSALSAAQNSLVRTAATTEILGMMASQKNASVSAPTPKPTPSLIVRDFRPVARPSEYDTQFKHLRIYECGKNGAIDAVWRLTDERGRELESGKTFISGFAGELKDNTNGNAFYFSSVQLEPAPAFYSGQMPSQGSYYFPTIEFREDQVKRNISIHSRVPGLKPGKFAAAGTVYLPRTSSGNTVSVSLSLGSSLRGTPYQATAECTPASSRIRQWLKHCMATEAPSLPNPNCNL